MKKIFSIRNLCLSLFVLLMFLNNGCAQRDIISGNDFYIDLTNGNVTDRNGSYQSNIPDFTNLFLTGGEVYIFGIIVFKGLDQSYYALSQYHIDGCSVSYDVAYDELICPCDQFHFNKYGQETIGNGSSFLGSYMTSLNNNMLHVYTP